MTTANHDRRHHHHHRHHRESARDRIVPLPLHSSPLPLARGADQTSTRPTGSAAVLPIAIIIDCCCRCSFSQPLHDRHCRARTIALHRYGHPPARSGDHDRRRPYYYYTIVTIICDRHRLDHPSYSSSSASFDSFLLLNRRDTYTPPRTPRVPCSRFPALRGRSPIPPHDVIAGSPASPCAQTSNRLYVDPRCDRPPSISR